MFGLAFRALLLDGSVFQEIKDREETMFAALGYRCDIGARGSDLRMWVALRETWTWSDFDQQ